MGAALVVMAAGLGSRYGGNGGKQVEQVGPGGEILMEYTIWDAVRAGFDRIVLIIKPGLEPEFRELFGDRAAAAGVDMRYAFQRMAGDWEGIPIPAGRTKPLGTLHALLSAAEVLDRPFAVANADDFYGREALAALCGALPGLRGGGDAVMAAYRLRNTVSPFGPVTRGVCAEEGGMLRQVKETYRITQNPDGTIRDGGPDGPPLDPDAPVSMNLWGFHPDILPRLRDRFGRFLRDLRPGDNQTECPLPIALDEFLDAGTLACRCLDTDGRWFGLTYPADKAGVVAELKALHAAGEYPARLWGEQRQPTV